MNWKICIENNANLMSFRVKQKKLPGEENLRKGQTHP